MFFANSRIRFFKLVGSVVNNMERVQEKGIQSTQLSVQSFKITFILYLNVTDPINNSNDFCLLSSCEKALDNKKFSRENSKPHPESRFTTHKDEPCTRISVFIIRVFLQLFHWQPLADYQYSYFLKSQQILYIHIGQIIQSSYFNEKKDNRFSFFVFFFLKKSCV